MSASGLVAGRRCAYNPSGSPSHDSCARRSLGVYEIVGLVGAGRMGEVYRARDTRLGRDVAIKIISDRTVADPQFRDRFEREARAVSSLDHPDICALFDVGEHDGTKFPGDAIPRRRNARAAPACGRATMDIITTSEGHGSVVLNAHSTGALAAVLYAKDGERRERFSRIILNSPFLELPQGPLAARFGALIGRHFPSGFLQHVPHPTSDATLQNLTAIGKQIKDVDQISLRVDHRFASSDALFARLSTFDCR